MCSTSIIGSNCCGCDDDSSNVIKFNCNEITNKSRDFSLDLSDIAISYSGLDRKGLNFGVMNSSNDFVDIDSDFIIYKSALPVSVYDNEKRFTNINLKCEIVEIVTDDYYIDVKYKIKKLIEGNAITINDEEDFSINQKTFIERMWSPNFPIPTVLLPDNVWYQSSGKVGSLYVIEEKTKRIPKDVNENFDLFSYKWIDEFTYDGLTYKLNLAVANLGVVQETYYSSVDGNGSVVTTTENITYTSRWLKIESVFVNMSDSMYEIFALKHSPNDLIDLRNDSEDTINSYYGLIIFGKYKRISVSSFGMIPSSGKVYFVNENDLTNKIDIVGLTV